MTNVEENPNDEIRTGCPQCERRFHSLFVISSSFVIRAWSFNSSFHISNWRESRDWPADPRELGRCDHLINIFVSATRFLGETRP